MRPIHGAARRGPDARRAAMADGVPIAPPTAPRIPNSAFLTNRNCAAHRSPPAARCDEDQIFGGRMHQRSPPFGVLGFGVMNLTCYWRFVTAKCSRPGRCGKRVHRAAPAPPAIRHAANEPWRAKSYISSQKSLELPLGLASDRPDHGGETGQQGSQSHQGGWVENKHFATPLKRPCSLFVLM